jgi:hypothetical protein
MGSDVARDGLFLELWDRPSNELALWAFFSDADGSFEVTRYRADVPPETVHRGKVCPQLFRTVVTAIPHVERDDLTRPLVHGDPNPLLVGLLLHEAPHLICFNLKTSNDHIMWGRHGLYM